MTERYDLLLHSISDTNVFLVQMFLFALVVVLTLPVIQWIPEPMRRYVRPLYLGSLLVMFIFTTVYSGRL